MEINILQEKIVYYKNVLEDPYELIKVIEDLDHLLEDDSPLSKWQEWYAYQSEYSFGKQKKFINSSTLDLSLPKAEECFYIFKKLKLAIDAGVQHYSSVVTDDIGFLSPLSISKYSEGKMMGPHVDAHNDDPTKTISCVLYLNDDYEGGELNFPDHEIMIKPEAGSLVIFPSKYMHESKILKTGTKYMSPGFWNKMV